MSTVREIIDDLVSQKLSSIVEEKVAEYYDSVSGNEGGEGGSESVCVTEFHEIGRLALSRIPVNLVGVSIAHSDYPGLVKTGSRPVEYSGAFLYMRVFDIPEYVVGMKFTNLNTGYSVTYPLLLDKSSFWVDVDSSNDSASDNSIIRVNFNGYIGKNQYEDLIFDDEDEDTRYLAFWINLEGLTINDGSNHIAIYFF